MRRLIPNPARALAAALLLAAAATPGTPPAEAAAPCASVRSTQDTPPAKCCFTNPGFAGTCEVQPGKDESCSKILDYLNNPMSQGKGYCGNTTIRGGWKSASCEPRQS